MTKKPDGTNFLENAYSLKEPSDSVRYYDTVASSYDQDFAADLGYHYPLSVAQSFQELAEEDDFPIADIGCGTGLVAEALSVEPRLIDGMDISAQMLEVARHKGLYRSLYQVDLTASLKSITNGYGAVLSAGTFTHGHLGPEPLAALLEIARPGALFVIGINKEHFDHHGFDRVIDQLQSDHRVHAVAFREVSIYRKVGHPHDQDRALIVSFRKS